MNIEETKGLTIFEIRVILLLESILKELRRDLDE